MQGNVEHQDPWIGRVPDYLDDELPAGERLAFERHVATCGECGALLESLRQVVAQARALNRPEEPPRDLWPGISDRLQPRPARRPAFSWGTAWLRPGLAAAALALLACGVLLWTLLPPPAEPRREATTRPAPVAPIVASDRDYETTVARLHREARARLTLDPHVVEVLDENIATLDAAIATYRDALSEEPGDAELRSRLDEARHRKLEVLQQAVALAAEESE